ncbi:MAG: 30S ribosomal protein S4 [Vampirovibrionales bacterium]|nr:30S ribosomal protein S4 [Vampirovibrionales bacterium]
MARYRESIRKLARNTGGTLDGYPKSENLRRAYPSGQHGQARKKLSEYAVQLKEKQKVRRIYGILEKPFRTAYKKAVRKKGVTGTLLLQSLESRLDNILYRSGLAQSRPQSRQLISHCHILVNGRKVNVPSYQMKIGDIITVRERSKALFRSLQEGRSPVTPSWLEVDAAALAVRFAAVPMREEIDPTLNEHLIIEFYSR